MSKWLKSLGFEYEVKVSVKLKLFVPNNDEWQAEDIACEVFDKISNQFEAYFDDYGEINHKQCGNGYEIEAEQIYLVNTSAFNHEQAMRDAEEVFNCTVIPSDIEMSVEAYDYEWVKEPCYEIVGE